MDVGANVIAVCGEGIVDLVDEGGGVYRAHPGGSPLNVAVGVARLGVECSLLGRFGTDPFGRLLRAHLAGSGASTRDLVAAAEPSTLAVVSLDEAGRATYDFYMTGTADWQWTDGELPVVLADGVTALHVGSLASWLLPGAERIEEMLRRERARGVVTLSYDPNVRPGLMGERGPAVARVERFVGLADLVKVSEDDLGWLYPGDAAGAAARWATAGPALVVVTRGAGGAVAVSASGVVVRRPARAVEVVDTVGAGDAFTAGLLTGLAEAGALGPGGRAAIAAMDAAALGALLDRAGLVAALTCTRAGAAPPTRAEVAAAR